MTLASRRRTASKPEKVRKARHDKPLPVQSTPLAERLRAPQKATPKDLFDLALGKWNAGERFDIGKMAEELNVSRATVFRWVGSRELLYGEVISSLFEAALSEAASEARGEGPSYIEDVTRKLMAKLIAHEPLRTFVKQDPEYAMRILMSKSSTVEQRCAASVQRALEAYAALGQIRPLMKLSDLAYLIVRIGESFLYRESITGDPADTESATTAIRILIAAER